MRILLVITGHTIEPVRSVLGNTDKHFKAVAKSAHLTPYAICENVSAHDLNKFDGVMMTGSAAMLADNLPWMHAAQDLIKRCLDEEIPFLGVCFGHQMLGIACGAQVGPNPKGRQNGTCLVKVASESPLFNEMPHMFEAQVSHRDVILESRSEFVVTATTAHDPHHAIQVAKKAFGVQFHPEWDMNISKGYIDARQDSLGADLASKMRATLRPSAHAAMVVQNFINMCR